MFENLMTSDGTFLSRSSSALNLALSEAASNAYAHAHLPVSNRPCLPTPPMLETHDPRILRQLVASQRLIEAFVS